MLARYFKSQQVNAAIQSNISPPTAAIRAMSRFVSSGFHPNIVSSICPPHSLLEAYQQDVVGYQV